MRITHYLAALALACALMIILAYSAEAQTQSTGSIVFETFRPFMVEIVSALILALVGWLVAIVRQKFGIDIDAKHRDALQAALLNAAGLIISRVGGTTRAFNLPASSPELKRGVEYVLSSVPDALKHFGITPETASHLLTEKLEAKIGLLSVTATPEKTTPPVVALGQA